MSLPGALKKAAESAQAKNAVSKPAKPLRRVGVSVVEAYGKDVEPRELEATLRMEYRTKLLNPKWAEAMVKQVRSFEPCRYHNSITPRIVQFGDSLDIFIWLSLGSPLRD